jgi:predicted NBD/HSP70 family sugar kinase
VETALRVRLERPDNAPSGENSSLREVDAQLRHAAGRFEAAREICWNITDGIRNFGDAGLPAAASQILERWRQNSHAGADIGALVADALAQVAAEKARLAFGTLDALAQELAQALQTAAKALDLQDVPSEGELGSVLKEMPRMDLGTLDLNLRPSIWINVWKGQAQRRVESRLRAQIGHTVAEAFSSYGRMLEAWTRRMLAELQRRFDAHADGYRAHLDRITAQAGATPLEKETIQPI